MFVRGILPAEPAQWLLLLGSTFLFMSPRLRWWSQHSLRSAEDVTWSTLTFVMALPLAIAGAAGYFISLLPTRRPGLRTIAIVLIPSLASFWAILLIGIFWYPAEVAPDIYFQSTGDRFAAIPHILAASGTGPHVATVGILLVAIFAAFICFGRATAPLYLTYSRPTFADVPGRGEKDRLLLFVWIMICLTPVAFFASGLFDALLIWISAAPTLRISLFWIDEIGSSLCLLALVLLSLGKERVPTLRSALFRRISFGMIALGIAFPVALGYAPLLFHFVYDRIQWAAHNLGSAPPVFVAYIPAIGLASAWYFIPALVEEIAWRGYLQPRFITRYGLGRGIFFVAIVWAAFHFFEDSSHRISGVGMLYYLAIRPATTLALSYVFAWLTIKAGSVIPAALAHGIYNAFILSANRYRAPIVVTVVLWAILGYILFRYFPPASPQESTDSTTGSAREMAAPNYG